MDKQWIAKKYNDYLYKMEKSKLVIIQRINSSGIFTSMDKKYLIDKVRSYTADMNAEDFEWIIHGIHGLNYPDDTRWFLEEEKVVYDELDFDELRKIKRAISNLGCLMDSNWVYLEGDIVITDPCYTTDKWCDGFDLRSLPLCRNTIYGDWSCTTYNSESKEKIGHFCADAGMVCVDTLENILKRKPDFLEKYNDWCRTIIKNFKGNVGFCVVCVNEESEEEKLDTWDFEVRVMGEGINTETGEKISFFTTQTGL